MAVTTYHQPNSSEFKLLTQSTSANFFIQNISGDKTPIVIVWASSVPAADTKGHVLQPGDGVVRNSLTGNVYARAMARNAIVAITEEV